MLAGAFAAVTKMLLIVSIVVQIAQAKALASIGEP